MDIISRIRTVENFPKEGISFKDITTLLNDAEAFKYTVDLIADRLKDQKIDYIVGIEARGFLFGTVLAYKLGAGFVPARKPGKLPAETVSCEYALEYGTDKLEIHKDAIKPGSRVLIVDDLLATGGTAAAVENLVSQLSGELVGFEFLIELDFLNGREKLQNQNINVLVHY